MSKTPPLNALCWGRATRLDRRAGSVWRGAILSTFLPVCGDAFPHPNRVCWGGLSVEALIIGGLIWFDMGRDASNRRIVHCCGRADLCRDALSDRHARRHPLSSHERRLRWNSTQRAALSSQLTTTRFQRRRRWDLVVVRCYGCLACPCRSSCYWLCSGITSHRARAGVILAAFRPQASTDEKLFLFASARALRAAAARRVSFARPDSVELEAD